MTAVVKLAAAHRLRAERKTLCRSGLHQWQIETTGRLDVKQEKLLTVQRCKRCGEQRSKRT